MDFSELYVDRQGFRKHIIAAIGQDLNGYVLEDVAFESLEQTPLEYLDHNNTLDAEGIKKITIITAREAEETNRRTREKIYRSKNRMYGRKESSENWSGTTRSFSQINIADWLMNWQKLFPTWKR